MWETVSAASFTNRKADPTASKVVLPKFSMSVVNSLNKIQEAINIKLMDVLEAQPKPPKKAQPIMSAVRGNWQTRQGKPGTDREVELQVSVELEPLPALETDAGTQDQRHASP